MLLCGPRTATDFGPDTRSVCTAYFDECTACWRCTKKQTRIWVKFFVLLSPCLKGQVMPTSLYLCHKLVLANICISGTEWMKSPVPCNMVI